MSEFMQELPKVSIDKPKGKIKKVVIDLKRGDLMHVKFKIGNKVVLLVEATPGNLHIEPGFDGQLRHEINFYTRTLPL